MEPTDAIRLLESLAMGRDPYSGGSLPENSPYHHPSTIRALMLAVRSLASDMTPPAAPAGSPTSDVEQRPKSEESAITGGISSVADVARHTQESERQAFNPEQQEIFDQLREWRRSIARERRLPPYCILYDKTLTNLIRAQPKSREDLLSVWGLAATKIEQYGDDLLAILNPACVNDQIASASESTSHETVGQPGPSTEFKQTMESSDMLDSVASSKLELSSDSLSVTKCEACGVPIHPERLEAIPEATVCVECQRNRENAPKDWRRPQGVDCPRCAHRGIRSPLVWRNARDPNIPGYFLGCSSYPRCHYTE